MSFAEQRITPRRVKLAWIALIGAMLGFLVAEALGALHWPAWLVMMGLPVALGLILGWIGLGADGQSRNHKTVLIISTIVAIVLLSIVAVFVHALLNSTDL